MQVQQGVVNGRIGRVKTAASNDYIPLDSGFAQILLGRKGARFRAKPEFLWPGEFRARSPLPDGRVDYGAVLSGYANSGFAIMGLFSRRTSLAAAITPVRFGSRF